MARYPTYDAIRKLLLEEWQPLGPGVPDDEYDQYSMGIWSRLEKGASVDEVKKYLHWAATENMGMTGGDPDLVHALERSLAERAFALKSK